jgi:hypothetical protein
MILDPELATNEVIVYTQPRTLKAIEIDPEADPRWEAFVTAHPKGLIYHHPAWVEVLKMEYDRRSIGLACVDGEGQIRGVLPLMETRGLRFDVGRQIVGRRLSSLPRTPVAGPLALDEQAQSVLVEAAVARVRQEPRLQLQLKMDSDSMAGPIQEITGGPWRLTYVLDLPERPEWLRFGNSRNHSRIKWAVNKASKLGVVVRPAETERELRAWYQLYLDTMRWHSAPPRPYRFFLACWELLQPRGMMNLLLAERQEKGRLVLLAGSIFLMFGQTVFYAFNGRRREDLSLRPNDAILWHAIHELCGKGFRRYDFGEVVEDNVGLAEFKGKWGTNAKWLYRYYFPAIRQPDAGAEATIRRQRMVNALWRRLPLQVTSMLGNQIYGYL